MALLGFRDRVQLPTGRFHLTVLRAGRVVEVMDEPNMVVVGAQTVLAALLAGAPGGGITSLGVGWSMMPAAFGNAALTSPFVKPVDKVSQPVPTQVQYAFTLASGDANGIAIGEFGLLTAAGILVARKARTVAALTKDSSMALVGTWTLDFGVSP